MTAKSLVKKSDLLRMARVAKEFGVAVSQEQDGVTIRVSPFDGAGVAKTNAQLRARLGSPRPTEPINPPLNHLETAVMKALIAYGVGVGVALSTIRLLGPRTQRDLLARGYIAVSRNRDIKNSDAEIRLTDKGRADWSAIEKYNKTYPRL